MKPLQLIIGLSLLLLMALALLSAQVSADDASAPADRLTGIYYAMRAGQLPMLPGQPVYVHSEVDKKRLKADVYSIVHYRLANLARTLSHPRNWCRFVTLHLNVKACTWRSTPDPVLRIYVGRKFYQPPEDATRMDYRFQVVAHDQRRLVVLLTAERGELSTRDHRVRLEAERMNDSDVLLHFSVSYRQSLASRMATRAYLSTLGRSKMGFSRQTDGSTGDDYVGGMRGIVERNAMRYFLALVVYMDSLGQNGPQVQSRRIREWFDLTQRYATQLHEVDRTDYLIDKRREFANQRKLQSRIDTPPCSENPWETKNDARRVR